MNSIDDYTISNFTVATTTVMPTHLYHLRPSAYYSTEAVAEEFTNPMIGDIPSLDNREHREALQTILQEGEIWTDDIPTGLAEEPPSEAIEWTVGFSLTGAIHDEA